jgi:hypothetical protein
VPLILFCQCGSDRVDITQWNGTRARLRCFTCEREAWLDGFTVSDLDPVNGERRSFALLRPVTDTTAQESVRDVILAAYAELEAAAGAES